MYMYISGNQDSIDILCYPEYNIYLGVLSISVFILVNEIQ